MNHDDVWRQHAACTRGLALPTVAGVVIVVPFDPDLFFPRDGHHETSQRAKSICAVCPVAEDCLAYALDSYIRDGIWGGTSLRQREVIWRERRRAQERPEAS